MTFKINNLIDELKKNKKVSVEKSIQALYQNLVSYVINHGGTREEALDLIQDAYEVFINLQKSEKIDSEKANIEYFIGIYKNLWYRFLREKENKKKAFSSLQKTLDETEISVFEEIERIEKFKLIRKHIKRLPEHCRSIFELIEDGKTNREIIESMEYERDQYYRVKSRCKKKLLEMLLKDPNYRDFL